jgi:hypothetical protein
MAIVPAPKRGYFCSGCGAVTTSRGARCCENQRWEGYETSNHLALLEKHFGLFASRLVASPQAAVKNIGEGVFVSHGHFCPGNGTSRKKQSSLKHINRMVEKQMRKELKEVKLTSYSDLPIVFDDGRGGRYTGSITSEAAASASGGRKRRKLS